MKIAFFLDVKLKEKDAVYYTTGAADYKYFNSHKITKNDELIVLCRQEATNNIQGLAKSSGEKVKFITISNYKELFNKKMKNNIKEMIDNTDLCIVKLPTIIGLFICHILNKKNKKIIIEMVGSPLEALWYRGGIIYKIVAPIIYKLNKYYIKKAVCVTYVSNNFLQNRYPTEGKKFTISDVLIRDIDKEVLNNRINKIKRLDINTAPIKIGLIGALDVNYKGHLTAIKALKILKNKFENIELHFLGNGNQERWKKIAKKNKVKNNIIFDATLPHEEIYKWFDNMDIYIIPSMTEGMPRSLIEAMSRGCPCIGTQVGGISELLDEDMMIKKKNYKQLAQRISDIINDKEKMIFYSEKNIKKVVKYQSNDINKEIEKYHNFILKEAMK
ncbi:MAG: glycosyltransferase family 4 protein [Clostridia bacterium]